MSNQLEIKCTKKNILNNLIGKECYINMLSDDYDKEWFIFQYYDRSSNQNIQIDINQ